MASPAEFLELLSGEDRSQLERIARRGRADRAEVLIVHGDPGDSVLVITKGYVKVVVPSGDGGETVLAFRGPGALLGDQALIDSGRRSALVVAVEPVELLVVAASAFRGFLERRPGVMLAMLGVLSARLREADRRLNEFASADVLTRVSARIVELCETHGVPGESGTVRIALPISQEELAGWAGASLESTAKALRTLRSLGRITTGRRTIEVRDLPALRRQLPATAGR
ncbi:MAG: Crp/Fnr family transcriptional regulator [Solirubrobacteraceae bacterium]